MKKKIRYLLLIFIGILMMGSLPKNINACSCVELPSVKEELDRSDAVLSGKVVSIKEKRRLDGLTFKSVLFEITNSWKGDKKSQAIIITGQGGGDCGFEFVEGQKYLVYAIESDMYGEKSLVTTICDRTNELSSSQEDIKLLGKGQPPIEKVDLSDEQEGNQLYIWGIVVFAIGIIVTVIFKKRRKSI